MRRVPTDQQVTGAARPGASFRAVFLGCLLLSVLLALTPYNDYFVLGSYMANHHVPVAASFVLFLLGLVVNPLLRTVGSGRRALSMQEQVVIWAMMATTSGLASAGFLRFLVPVLPALRYFATPENKWQDLLFPLVPGWLVPTEERAIRWFYDGAPPGVGIPWGAWAAPVLAWSALGLLLCTILLCLAILLRAQWIDHERMAFPHVQFPMALIAEPDPGHRLAPLFRDRLMWAGFAAPFVLYGLTGAAKYFPGIPTIAVLYPHYYSHPLVFNARPWDAAGTILLAVLPSMIGFGFLITTEVSLSLWVFFVLCRLEEVLFAALGFEMRSVISGFASKQFSAYQDMGVYLALVVVSLYVARGHLRQAWRQALSGRGDAPAWYRGAILGGLTALVLVLVWHTLAGVAWPVALAFYLCYLLVCVGVSWLTSNTGMLLISAIFRPEDYLYACYGTRGLHPRDIAVLSLPSRAFAFYYNELIMPHYLNNFKLSQESKTPLHSVLAVMIAALPLGMAVAWAAHLHLAYTKGAHALQAMSFLDWSRTPYNMAVTYITQPHGPDPMSYIMMTGGAAAFALVSALRARCEWWPLHPAGLLLGNSSAETWLSFFIAWLCKTLILRYGGARAYRRARSFFLGLVAGEMAIGCLWNAVGFLTGTGVRLLP